VQSTLNVHAVCVIDEQHTVSESPNLIYEIYLRITIKLQNTPVKHTQHYSKVNLNIVTVT